MADSSLLASAADFNSGAISSLARTTAHTGGRA